MHGHKPALDVPILAWVRGGPDPLGVLAGLESGGPVLQTKCPAGYNASRWESYRATLQGIACLRPDELRWPSGQVSPRGERACGLRTPSTVGAPGAGLRSRATRARKATYVTRSIAAPAAMTRSGSGNATNRRLLATPSERQETGPHGGARFSSSPRLRVGGLGQRGNQRGRDSMCAVQRCWSSVGAIPTWQVGRSNQ
jgi:hypothetical protein